MPDGATSTTSSFSTGFNWLGNDNCKTRHETFKFLDLVWLILEIWQYFKSRTLYQIINFNIICTSGIIYYTEVTNPIGFFVFDCRSSHSNKALGGLNNITKINNGRHDDCLLITTDSEGCQWLLEANSNYFAISVSNHPESATNKTQKCII